MPARSLFKLLVAVLLLAAWPARAAPQWHTQTLAPSGSPLISIWGSSSTNLYVLVESFESYQLLHSTDGGTSWTPQIIDGGRGLYLSQIWGSGPNDIYVVGEQGTILHSQDGVTWQSQKSGTKKVLRAVWGSSAKEVFAAGEGGVLLYTKDSGKSWKPLKTGTSKDIFALWGSSPSDLYAAGADGLLLRSTDGGRSWTQKSTDTQEPLLSLWGSGEEVYAVGWSGVILRSIDQGETWEQRESGVYDDLRSVWGSSATDVYAVGALSVLHSSNRGETWSEIGVLGTLYYSVWGTSATNVLLGAAFGELFYLEEVNFREELRGWSELQSGVEDPLNAISGAGGYLYAVGYGGLVLRSNDRGKSWEKRPSGLSAEGSLDDVWAASPTEVYAVGWGGLILYSQDAGETWKKLVSGVNEDLHSVWGRSPNEVYVVGEQGTILKSVDQGKTWKRLRSGTESALWEITAREGGGLYAFGDDGVLLSSKDGVSWRKQTLAEGKLNLRGLLQGKDELIVAGFPSFYNDDFDFALQRMILRIKNDKAAPRPIKGAMTGMFGLYSDPSGRAFAVGFDGVIYASWDHGVSWTRLQTQRELSFRGIWGSGEDIYAVGDGGSIFYMGTDPNLAAASLANLQSEPQTLSLEVLGLEVKLPAGVGVWKAYPSYSEDGDIDIVERVTPGEKPLFLYLIYIDPAMPLSCADEIEGTIEHQNARAVNGGQAYLPSGWYPISAEYQITQEQETRVCRETHSGKGLLVNITQQDAAQRTEDGPALQIVLAAIYEAQAAKDGPAPTLPKEEPAASPVSEVPAEAAPAAEPVKTEATPTAEPTKTEATPEVKDKPYYRSEPYGRAIIGASALQLVPTGQSEGPFGAAIFLEGMAARSAGPAFEFSLLAGASEDGALFDGKVGFGFGLTLGGLGISPIAGVGLNGFAPRSDLFPVPAAPYLYGGGKAFLGLGRPLMLEGDFMYLLRKDQLDEMRLGAWLHYQKKYKDSGISLGVSLSDFEGQARMLGLSVGVLAR